MGMVFSPIVMDTVSSAPPFHSSPDIVLYHADCSDGFGAAWALWKKFPSATFVPVKHGQPPPPDLKDRRVVIVDFSYGRPILESMASETKELLILDHHITAERTLDGFPNAYFDQTKSGAVLGWEWGAWHHRAMVASIYSRQGSLDVGLTWKPRDQCGAGLLSHFELS
ncbi:MAG: hypothetical protein HC794_07045 [Nitrospiraceae bacterium]|nr:hypothetical protein [Nitrospiraceae bacterium]